MAKVTPTEISTENVVSNDRGTATTSAIKRRVRLFIRKDSNTADDTITLSDYVTNLADVEGVIFESIDGAVSGTSLTWSTAILTLTSAGDDEISLVGTF